jgi:hypothetical protein
MPRDQVTLVEPSFPVYSLLFALLGAIGIPPSVWSFSVGMSLTELVLSSSGIVVSAVALFGGLYRCWTNQRRFERDINRALADLQKMVKTTDSNTHDD